VDPKEGYSFLPVNLIRTVGIVLVILLHSSTEAYINIDLMSNQGVQIWWASNIFDSIARVCIPLFVMLAGALSLQPSKADEPLKLFFKKRWTRLGLPFIFWCVVYFVWGTFIHGTPLTPQSVTQGVLTGPHYHFWFIYLLVGLYLLTPILRVTLKYANRKILKYTLVVWFIGTAVAPAINIFGAFSLNANFFIFTGWLGYFILGAYLVKSEIKKGLLYVGLIGGLLLTMGGTYLIVGTLGEKFSQYFYDGFSVNMIIASICLFLLLLRAPNVSLLEHSNFNKVLSLIGNNTLAIYLFHVIVLESLQNGYFGLTLSITSMNPFIGIPLSAALTLLICLVVIVPLKWIPYIKRVIG